MNVPLPPPATSCRRHHHHCPPSIVFAFFHRQHKSNPFHHVQTEASSSSTLVTTVLSARPDYKGGCGRRETPNQKQCIKINHQKSKSTSNKRFRRIREKSITVVASWAQSDLQLLSLLLHRSLSPWMMSRSIPKTKLCIIENGPPAHTTAIYTARVKLKPILFAGWMANDIDPGGQLTTTTRNL